MVTPSSTSAGTIFSSYNEEETIESTDEPSNDNCCGIQVIINNKYLPIKFFNLEKSIGKVRKYAAQQLNQERIGLRPLLNPNNIILSCLGIPFTDYNQKLRTFFQAGTFIPVIQCNLTFAS